MPGSLVSATESSWTSTVLTLRFLPFKQLAPTYAVDNRLQGRETEKEAAYLPRKLRGTVLYDSTSSQETLGLLFPSSSNRPLVFKAHACTGGLSRGRFPANSLAKRQNHLEMLLRTKGSLFCRSFALTLWFCSPYERSTIILVEMFSDMCRLEDNVSRNCQTNTVARSV